MNQIRSIWSRFVWPLVVFKGIYWILLLLAVTIWQEPGYGEIGQLQQRWPLKGGPSFSSHFATWDAGFYLYLSAVGYHAGDEACAFYPLFPLCIGCFADPFGGDHLIFGLILSNLFSLAGFAMFYYQLCERFEQPVARSAMLFLLLFPGAIFFQLIFSETLFFLLIMIVWFGLDHRRYTLVWTAAFLLPLTRAIGIFCLLPIAWHCLRQYPPQFLITYLDRHPRLSHWISLSNPNHPLVAWPKDHWINRDGTSGDSIISGFHSWILILAPLLGWITYLALMQYWTGNPFEGYQAQKNWGAHSFANLINIPKFIAGFFSPTEWHAFHGSVLDRCFFVILLYSLPLLWRLDQSLVPWALILGVIPAMSGTFTSYTRFASVVFPVAICFAYYFRTPNRKLGLIVVLSTFAAFHILMLFRYTTCRWVG